MVPMSFSSRSVSNRFQNSNWNSNFSDLICASSTLGHTFVSFIKILLKVSKQINKYYKRSKMSLKECLLLSYT